MNSLEVRQMIAFCATGGRSCSVSEVRHTLRATRKANFGNKEH
jgi:hypothetical protein